MGLLQCLLVGLPEMVVQGVGSSLIHRPDDPGSSCLLPPPPTPPPPPPWQPQVKLLLRLPQAPRIQTHLAPFEHGSHIRKVSRSLNKTPLYNPMSTSKMGLVSTILTVTHVQPSRRLTLLHGLPAAVQ